MIDDHLLSKPKTIALAIVGFVVAALALTIMAIALGALFSIPVVTPLATAAIAAVAVGGTLSQGAFLAIAVGTGVLFLGSLVTGSLSVDVLRIGEVKDSEDDFADSDID